MRQLKDIDPELGPEERARLNAAAKSWLKREDPIAKEISQPSYNEEERKAEAERTKQRTIEHGQEIIRREWKALCLEPMTGGNGTLISVSLAKSLGVYPPKPAQGEAA